MGFVRTLVFAAIALLGGCAVDVEVPWIPAESDLELGTGDDEFQPLSEEAQLAIVLGPQGGFHVVGNVRVRGIPSQGPLDEGYPITFWVETEDGAMISLDTGPVEAKLRRQPDGTYVCAPGHHVLVEGDVEQITGTRADFGVEMRDARGNLVTDVRPVVLVYGE